MNKIKSIVIFLCLLPLTLLAQQNVDFIKDNFPEQKDQLKEALNNIKEGEKILEDYAPNYNVAVSYFLAANSFNPNNALLNYKIGKCYVKAKSSNKAKAIPFLEKAYKMNANLEKDMRYLLGQAYHSNTQFEEAIKYYQMALQTGNSGIEPDVINKKISECEAGKEIIKNRLRVFIDNAGSAINTKDPEYSPSINADESMMIFISRRPTTTGGGTWNVEGGDGLFMEDIYISYKDANGNWQAPINPGKPLNTNSHDGCVALAPDGQRLLIFRGESNGGDIYECTLKGTEWIDPERMKKPINSEDFEPSATYSPDDKALYFVSNRAGGFGGLDIYVVYKDEKGKWGEARNLGPTVNTRYNEDAIFLHPDGKTLYFSSQGHNTIGEYDIFKSTLEGNQWSVPVNVGYPINTPDDDRFLTVSASGKHGYYSSAKEGGYGGHDIYMVTFMGPEMPLVLNTEDNLLAGVSEPITETIVPQKLEVATNPLTILKGVTLDESTQKPVGAKIVLTDNEKNVVIATFESNTATGKYLVSLPSGKNYGIAVINPNYLFHSENVDIKLSTSYNEIVKDISLKKIDVGKKIVLRNIFFDFGKATLRNESVSELDRLTQLLTENPSIKIEISGHTDNKSSREFNMKLSESRAKAVVDYLITKGIAADRMTYKGFGFDQPIATNETEEGRQLNRRTEFKIVSK